MSATSVSGAAMNENFRLFLAIGIPIVANAVFNAAGVLLLCRQFETLKKTFRARVEALQESLYGSR